MGFQDSLQSFLLRELNFETQQGFALLLASDSPAGVTIDNHVILRDYVRLFEDCVTVLFQLQDPFVCWPEA